MGTPGVDLWSTPKGISGRPLETFGRSLLNIILLGRKSFGVETLRGIRSTKRSKSIHTGDGVSERLRLFLFLRDGSGAAQVSPVIFGGFVQRFWAFLALFFHGFSGKL